MRILYSTSNVSIPGTSGDTTHVQELCRSFSKHSKVYNITYRKKGQKFKENFSRNFVTYRIFDFPFVRALFLFTQTFFLSLYLIISKKIDVVYERGKLFGGGAILAAAILRKPRVYELNEPIIESLVLEGRMKEESLFHKLARFWINWNFKLSHKITGTHKCMLSNIESKSEIIHYGADTNKFRPKVKGAEKIKKKYSLKGTTFYYIGSFAPWHNLEQIVEAGIQIAKKYPKTKFILAGKQHKKGEKIERMISNSGVNENFILIDKIPYKDVPKWNSAVDVCLAIFDENYEPFRKFDFFYSPIKIHEYLASGKPVIASRMGNLAKIIKNKKTGILVKPNSVNSLRRAMEFFVKNKKELQKMGRAARKSAEEKFNWDKVAEDITQIFLNIK